MLSEKWKRVSAPIQLQARKSIIEGVNGNLSRRTSADIIASDPKEIVDGLREMTRPNFGPMHQALQSCTQEWMLGFLEHGGLEQLFECLSVLSSPGGAAASRSGGSSRSSSPATLSVKSTDSAGEGDEANTNGNGNDHGANAAQAAARKRPAPFSSLRSRSDSGGMLTAVGLLQCVMCIKSVMNSRCGLDYLIDTGKEQVKSLTAGKINFKVHNVPLPRSLYQ